ncbi:MAG: hypothetical protein LBQ66_14865 [Planctomycetaceae bacterium]|nr:hypothetical protein [Planctomycetaceae bacterium]
MWYNKASRPRSSPRRCAVIVGLTPTLFTKKAQRSVAHLTSTNTFHTHFIGSKLPMLIFYHLSRELFA